MSLLVLVELSKFFGARLLLLLVEMASGYCAIEFFVLVCLRAKVGIGPVKYQIWVCKLSFNSKTFLVYVEFKIQNRIYQSTRRDTHHLLFFFLLEYYPTSLDINEYTAEIRSYTKTTQSIST